MGVVCDILLQSIARWCYGIMDACAKSEKKTTSSPSNGERIDVVTHKRRRKGDFPNLMGISCHGGIGVVDLASWPPLTPINYQSSIGKGYVELAMNRASCSRVIHN